MKNFSQDDWLLQLIFELETRQMLITTPRLSEEFLPCTTSHSIYLLL